MDLFTILIVAVFTCETFHLFYKWIVCVKIYQIVLFKYVQFVVCQLYFNKPVKIKLLSIWILIEISISLWNYYFSPESEGGGCWGDTSNKGDILPGGAEWLPQCIWKETLG